MQQFLLVSVKVPQTSLIRVTLTQRRNFFLGPSFLQKVSCPLVLHWLRAVRLFIQSGSDVPSLLSQVYTVNHAAGCSKLEVPSIQRRGTYISLRWVESLRKKKLQDPLQLWLITALRCLFLLNQSPAPRDSAVLKQRPHGFSWWKHCQPLTNTSNMGRITVPTLTHGLAWYLVSNFGN